MNFVGISFCLILLQNLILKIHTDCSLDIASSGTITSPNYPHKYDNNLDLTYSIRSPSDRPMTLVFLDFKVGNDNCSNDYLEIKDGDHVESRKVVCGGSLPDPFVAMSGIVVVRLHTNKKGKHKGFNAYFNDSRGCSIGMVNMTHGMLTSPNYPQDYENNLDYTFTIRSLSNRPITLVFLDFEVGIDDCDYDYVQLHDGDDVQETVCGYTLPDSFMAFSGVLIVQFHTSNKVTHKGFEAFYYDNLDCIQFTEARYTMITSPNNSNNTLWLYCIQSEQDLQMKLTFTRFDLQNNSLCENERIYVQNDIKEHSNHYGPFCGNELPMIPIVNTGIIFIAFISHQLRTSTGFSAHVDHVLDCSGHLKVSRGIIQTPNYPDEYDNNKKCSYQLSNLNNNAINLTFSDFQTQNNGNSSCEYDYVEIQTHDGYLKKLCGRPEVPFYLIISSGSKVTFHSDGDVTGKGFLAVFDEIKEHELPDVTYEQYPTSTVSTSLSSTEFESKDSTAVELSPTALNEASSISETNTQLLLKGQIEAKSPVPIIIGTVIGFVVLTILAILLILWYLRKKTASKKTPQTAFSNENYNIHYTKGSRTGNVSYLDGDTGYCNVENGMCKINTIDPNYDFATEIPKEHKNVTINNDDGEQESEYVGQEDSYNILNVHPSKSGNTEIYDRTTEGVYDSAKPEKDDVDIGLYDHTPNSPDHEYDSTVNIKRRIDDLYN